VGPSSCSEQRTGDVLNIFGFVSALRSPFDDIIDPESAYEVTYTYEQFICNDHGNWNDSNNYTNNWYANYSSGIIRIYLDDTPDADYSDPNTFKDGTMLLEAMYDSLLLGTVPSLVGQFHFTGGTLFDRVSRNGVGYIGHNIGAYWCYAPIDIWLLGYVGTTHSTIDIYVPYPSSWGEIKSIYK